MSVITDLEKPTEDDTEKHPARVDALVNAKIKLIREDKDFHKKAFERMREDMFMAHNGYDKVEWSDSLYSANVAGRHVKTKTAALYAKNPKATAKRCERLDFAVWDESPESLMLAFQTIQQAQMAQQQAAMTPEMTAMGQMVPGQVQLPPGFDFAQQVIADYQQGSQYRKQMDKYGKTLEILFAKALREQQPVDFKTSAKALVRRACTCGVGYVEINFQRETGPRAGLGEQLSDARARLDHLRVLIERAGEGDITEEMAEAAELETSINVLTSEPEIVLREGLVFDFPASTRVIPDKLTKQLVGFLGARHLTIEYLFTVEQITELFPDVDLKTYGYKGYNADGSLSSGPAQRSFDFAGEGDMDDYETDQNEGKGLVCVWKHYDKMTGAVYYVADGYPHFLREPAAPDVFVEGFWPVYALTFNATESETQLFPLSDVRLLRHQQMEHNRSRQGMREHREAGRPRFGTSKGLLDEEGRESLMKAKAFDVIEMNKDPGTRIADVLEAIPVPGVDPNLYMTEPFEQDRMLSVGASEAAYGGMSKATATESAISASSTKSSDDASIDDLDAFLTMIARDSGIILQREMSEEQVKKTVGPGAVWPTLSLQDIASEIYLEVEAGSSGKPNQAVAVDNFMKLAPILTTIPGVNQTALAKEGVKRLDDRLDVNEFIIANAPSIVAQNQMAGAAQATPAAGDPAGDPNQQGAEGAQNAPGPAQPESPGTSASFGSNQV
jgi:hypothetical protein